jgi:hypothetical protein
MKRIRFFEVGLCARSWFAFIFDSHIRGEQNVRREFGKLPENI